ncbi:MAG TPA: peptide deformylase [Patescibacteria group bacterium]|nr:peptide deformylase [Patescibacteria group bacterium]
MAKIITIPNPILREKSKPVVLDKKTLDLIKTLKKALTDEKGGVKAVGLAAVQIGAPKRVFVAYAEKNKKFLTFINPEIVWFSKRLTSKKDQKYEGCLSLPNKWTQIKRAKEIKVKYQTETGQIQTRKFSGPIAIIAQHEYDHLEGILFTDRVMEQKAKLYELKKDEEGKEYLEEIKP